MSLYNLKKGAVIDWIEQEVVLADFTDGAGAAGTMVLDQPLPIGAYVLNTLVTNVVAFAGDTTCVLTVGDGTDADRYNTGTPTIFASANMVDMGVASGSNIHAAAASVTLTATAGSDWGDVTGGAFSIRIVYLVGA